MPIKAYCKPEKSNNNLRFALNCIDHHEVFLFSEKNVWCQRYHLLPLPFRCDSPKNVFCMNRNSLLKNALKMDSKINLISSFNNWNRLIRLVSKNWYVFITDTKAANWNPYRTSTIMYSPDTSSFLNGIQDVIKITNSMAPTNDRLIQIVFHLIFL